MTPFTTHDQTQTELLNIETQTKPKHTDRTRRPRQGTEHEKQDRRSRNRKYWRANREDCDSQRKRENDKEESMITTTNHEQEL